MNPFALTLFLLYTTDKLAPGLPTAVSYLIRNFHTAHVSESSSTTAMQNQAVSPGHGHTHMSKASRLWNCLRCTIKELSHKFLRRTEISPNRNKPASYTAGEQPSQSPSALVHTSTPGEEHTVPKVEISIQDLPEELLLEILGFLDHSSVYLLRQTCRLFLRLSCDRQFQQYHDPWMNPMARPPHPSWTKNFMPPLLPRDESGQLRRLLRKDKFYDPCNRTYEDGYSSSVKEWLGSQLFCSACEVSHPRFLFATNQRTEAPSKRICIGRQGYIRACPHKNIFWSDIIKWQGQLSPPSTLSRLKTYKIECKECTNKRKVLGEGVLAMSSITLIEGEGYQSLTVCQEIPVFRLDRHRKLTFPELQRLCHNSPNKEVFASLSCPQMGPLDGSQAMCAFAANQCVGIWSSWAKIGGHGNPPDCFGCCLCRTIANPRADGRNLISGYSFHESYCRSSCGASYAWRQDRKTGIVTVSAEKYIYPLDTPYSLHWIAHLDPDSYSITSDVEGKRITWCPDENCDKTSRYRGVAGNLLYYSNFLH